MGHRTCSSIMLFVVSYGGWYLPYFYPVCKFKFNILVFLIVAAPPKLVLAPGAIIRDNTVYDLCDVFIPMKM